MTDLDIGIAGEYYCCYDLAINGVKAFPSEQGLPFDLVLLKDDKLYKVQVKTTKSLRGYDKNVYSHSLRNGKGSRREIYNDEQVDIIAFVNLVEKRVAYMWLKDCKSIMNFYPEDSRGKNHSEVVYKHSNIALEEFKRGNRTKALICRQMELPQGTLNDRRIKKGFNNPNLKYYKDFNINKLFEI